MSVSLVASRVASVGQHLGQYSVSPRRWLSWREQSRRFHRHRRRPVPEQPRQLKTQRIGSVLDTVAGAVAHRRKTNDAVVAAEHSCGFGASCPSSSKTRSLDWSAYQPPELLDDVPRSRSRRRAHGSRPSMTRERARDVLDVRLGRALRRCSACLSGSPDQRRRYPRRLRRRDHEHQRVTQPTCRLQRRAQLPGVRRDVSVMFPPSSIHPRPAREVSARWSTHRRLYHRIDMISSDPDRPSRGRTHVVGQDPSRRSTTAFGTKTAEAPGASHLDERAPRTMPKFRALLGSASTFFAHHRRADQRVRLSSFSGPL